MRCVAMLAMLFLALGAGAPVANAGELQAELAVSVVVVGACSASLAGDRLLQDCDGSPSGPGEPDSLGRLAAAGVGAGMAGARVDAVSGAPMVRLDRAAAGGAGVLTIVY